MTYDIDLPQIVSFAIGVVLPLLVGLVTRWDAASKIRAIVLIALSAITSFLAELLDALNTGTVFDLGTTALTAFGTFLIGVGTWFGFWQTTTAAKALKQTGGFIGGSGRPPFDSGGTVAP